jgi:ribonucleotide monophosphatase NagD (HAD superfamily)
VASDWWLDLRRSYTIGDSPQDVEAARRFGGTGCLVKTGWAAEDKFLDKARPSTAFIGDSITQAVEWVVGREQKNGEQRRTRQWDGAEDFENP